MIYLFAIIKLVLIGTILNVWLVRRNKSTFWRGGEANNMREEFSNYGLPEWFMVSIGAAKVILALLLLASFWYPALLIPSSVGIGLLMLGAIFMHFKVRDPIVKSLPATILLILAVTLIIPAW